MPTAAIGAEVMVGFPGETEAEFDETRRLIEELPFTYLHVFTYSARPGTPAAERPGQVPVALARERNRVRSEEHTSELQSPDHLVCRLLLEKKKSQTENISPLRMNIVCPLTC